MAPKGTLLLIGGAEDKGKEMDDIRDQNKEFQRLELLHQLIPKNGRKGKIEIVTAASSVPAQVEKTYTKAFKHIGFENIGFIGMQDRLEARNPEFTKRVEEAHTVFFSGGDQFILSSLLGGTDFVNVLREKYIHDDSFLVAGTSAGAMALSELMIYEGGIHEAIIKDDLQVSSGLGIISGCIIDTHFIKRGRFGRLAHAVTMNPVELGVGLGEDTALIITKGDRAECRGSGMVVIIDGTEILTTNITEIENGQPIFVENLKVHLLAKGNIFSISKRRITGYNRHADAEDNKCHSETGK
jgi:cyanophycinase